jgi:hypothetical protein
MGDRARPETAAIIEGTDDDLRWSARLAGSGCKLDAKERRK